MKKIVALLLALVMLTGLTVTALAAGEKSGTTKLTAKVPGPDYTIHIPADMTLEYGNTDLQLVGEFYVSDLVNVTKTINGGVTTTTLASGSNVIPTTYKYEGSSVTKNGGEFVGNMVVCHYPTDTLYTRKLYVQVSAEDWAAAAPGTYTATLTWKFLFAE